MYNDVEGECVYVEMSFVPFLASLSHGINGASLPKSLLIRGFFSDNSTFFERKLPLPPIILVNEIFFWSLLIVCVLLFLL